MSSFNCSSNIVIINVDSIWHDIMKWKCEVHIWTQVFGSLVWDQSSIYYNHQHLTIYFTLLYSHCIPIYVLISAQICNFQPIYSIECKGLQLENLPYQNSIHFIYIALLTTLPEVPQRRRLTWRLVWPTSPSQRHFSGLWTRRPGDQSSIHYQTHRPLWQDSKCHDLGGENTGQEDILRSRTHQPFTDSSKQTQWSC
jgi:hypothetical protein